MIYARPLWDKDGIEAHAVLERQYRLEPGTWWKMYITYGALTTRIHFGEERHALSLAKARVTELARKAMFVPKGEWFPVEED